MYKLKLFLSLLLVFSLLAPSAGLYAAGTGPTEYSPQDIFNGAMDISNIQSKPQGLSIIQTQINLVTKKISNSELTNLNRLPLEVRNNVLSLNTDALSLLEALKAEVNSKTDLEEIKNIMQSSYNATESAKLLAAYNQQVLLLKNYNRLYNTIQNSYQVVNDALSYIDLHDSSSPNYGGQDPFTIDTYNNEIVPLKQQLLAVKSSRLDIIKSGVDASIDNLNDITATGLADNINTEVLDLMQLDLPVYKDNYNNNVRSAIVGHVNQLVGAASERQNKYAASGVLDNNFTFSIELTNYGDSRLSTASEIRHIFDIGLTEAIDMVDSVPVIMKRALNKAEVLSIKQQLEALGATVAIYPPIPEEYTSHQVTQPSSFTVNLTGYTSKIPVVTAIRTVTGLGLTQAKALVDNVPSVIKVFNNEADALSAKATLEAATAVIEISLQY